MKLTIRTTSLTLREFETGDAEPLCRIESLPEVVRYQNFPARTLENATAYVASAQESARQEPRTCFELIATRPNNPFLGRVGAIVTGEATSLWYVIDPAHQGQGIASEATRALMDYLHRLGHHTFLIECDPRNMASRRVAEKLGFQLVWEKPDSIEIQDELVGSRLYRRVF
ncbi:MAG: GNAT family N-acetyltransferase [Fimbriimonas sp.]